MEIARSQITGLVLAGGRGSRMGGVDKGLLLHRGRPLALHAAERLAPQVGAVLINANRHRAAYAAFGWPVVADVADDSAADGGAAGADRFPGPLAGMLAGLRHSTRPYLATVACDTPCFPADLVQRLAKALHDSRAVMAMAVTPRPGWADGGGGDGADGAGGAGGAGGAIGAGSADSAGSAGSAGSTGGTQNPRPMPQPVFCLLHMSVQASLAAALQAGQHKVQAWADAQGCVQVLFDNAEAFANANTPQELQALQTPASPTTS